MLTATVIKFHKVDPAAAYIMLPYLGWTTFATVLTVDIYRRNPDVSPQCSTAMAYLTMHGHRQQMHALDQRMCDCPDTPAC